MIENVKNAWAILSRREQAILAAMGIIVSLMSAVVSLWFRGAEQELGYSVVRRIDKVFDVESSSRLRAAVVLATTNVETPIPEGPRQNAITGGGRATTGMWEVIERSVNSFEIEIVNCGSDVLWYAKGRPEGAKPMTIEI